MFALAPALADVIGTESGFSALCRQLDPDSVPLPDAPAMLASLANIEKLAAGAKVRLARRAEEAGQWKRDGYRSFAEWLARKTGTGTGVAQSALDTSKRITDQPDTEEALRNGHLSETQANTVSDAAKANPAAEQGLVNKAKACSVKDLREAAGKAKARADTDPEATHRRQHANRSCRTWIDPEGMFNLLLRNTPEIGAELKAALEPFLNHRFNQARHDGRHEAREAYAADAITDIFRAATGATANRVTAAKATAYGNGRASTDGSPAAGSDGTADRGRPTDRPGQHHRARQQRWSSQRRTSWHREPDDATTERSTRQSAQHRRQHRQSALGPQPGAGQRVAATRQQDHRLHRLASPAARSRRGRRDL